jgi:alkanesulfonate monooxygenase SsuD/methylene tetrahydromethanopterin reductase-like flavin-dependent oxidoreductase (luciferase family)
LQVSFLAMAAYDGPAPGIDVWPAPPEYCDPELARRSVGHTLELAELAEAGGFDAISVSEHHYAPYMMSPNSVVLAAAVSQRARTARIALLGPLVPLNNPVRLAEELAMLDAMSGGRISVLFLRGTPNEHKTYDTESAATRAMTQEGIDLVVKAWQATEPFAWHSAHYDFSTVSVWPRVVQQPHPPLFGSGNSQESIAFAASRRMGIAFSFAPPEAVRDGISLYRKECARAGWQPAPAHVIYRGMSYIAASDQQANDDAAAFFGVKMAEQAQLRSATLGGPPVNDLIITPYFLGGPGTVLDRFAVLRDIGVGSVDMAFTIGTHDQQRESVSLFARTVLPALHEWDDQAFPG